MRGVRRRESYEVFPNFNRMERVCEAQSQMLCAPLQITETNRESAPGYKQRSPPKDPGNAGKFGSRRFCQNMNVLVALPFSLTEINQSAIGRDVLNRIIRRNDRETILCGVKVPLFAARTKSKAIKGVEWILGSPQRLIAMRVGRSEVGKQRGPQPTKGEVKKVELGLHERTVALSIFQRLRAQPLNQVGIFFGIACPGDGHVSA
jgi:hypothetical protein